RSENKEWLRGLDSNQDNQIQSLVCCQLHHPGVVESKYFTGVLRSLQPKLSLNLCDSRAERPLRGENDWAGIGYTIAKYKAATGPECRRLHKPIQRSEERRVGKECRTRWWTAHEKEKKKNDR